MKRQILIFVVSLLFLCSCSTHITITHSVNFYDDNIKIKSFTVIDGQFVTTFEPQLKEGFTFDGWYYQDVLFDFSSPITEDITLIAHWTRKTYNVMFLDSDETIYTTSPTYYLETVVEPNSPTKTGYNFVGWYYQDTLFDFSSPITKDISLIAHWSQERYNVVFFNSDKTIYTTISVNSFNTAEKPDMPTKNGYIFDGWYYQDTVFDFSSPITNDISLTAHWSPIHYTVVFDSNFGTGKMESIICTYGEPFSLGECFFTAPEYQKFNSWSITQTDNVYYLSPEDTLINLTEIDGEKIIAKAEWIDKDPHFIYYLNYDQSIHNPNPINFKESERIELSFISKPGYQFCGWFLDENCQNSPINGWAPGSYTKDVTLYAKWKPNSYSVKFLKLNSSSEDIEEYTQNLTYDLEENLYNYNFQTPDNYTFVGWSSNPNQDAVYTDCQRVINLTSIENDVIKLYAVYKSSDASLLKLSLLGENLKISSDANYTNIIEPNVNIHEYYIEYCNEITIYAEANNEQSILTLNNNSENLVIKEDDSSKVDYFFTVTAPDRITKNVYILHTQRIFTINDAISAIENQNKDLSLIIYGMVESCKTIKNVLATKNNFTVELDFSRVEFSSFSFTDSSIFENCKTLKGIIIPHGVSKIVSDSFRNCSQLKNIKIPDTVTTIYPSAFEKCTSLEEIVIPKSCSIIYGNAFRSCTNLKTIILPSSLSKCDLNCFWGVGSNKNVYFEGTLEQWRNMDVSDSYATPCNNGANLYINGTLLTNLIIPDDWTYIRDSIFEDVKSLQSIVIGENVEKVGYAAFSGCTGIKYIQMGPNVQTISPNAFSGCTNLESINLPDQLTEISNYSFSCCEKLTHIVIPQNVTKIGIYAFYQCINLTDIILPASLKQIDYESFGKCHSLENIYYRGSKEDWGKIYISDNMKWINDKNIIYNYSDD